EQPAVGHPSDRPRHAVTERNLVRLAGAGRIEDDLRRIRTSHERGGALSVRGEALAVSFSEADRRRAVQAAEIDRVSGTAAFAGLGEQNESAVLRDVVDEAPVEPGQIDVLPGARTSRDDADLIGVV